MACSDDSDCINRLTSIECVNWKCFCGSDCRNQRFQKHEFANVDVIETEKKGYGLRALDDLPQGTFVYEYIGEVISEGRFRKRAEEYKSNGNKHFYFMMLQKGEYIDATTKGCLARFCNHSCNPNCYVDKWVVGDKLRMGIFTKRDILKGEEITFDYNVDRYGSDAQPCYCGEPNCIGILGGKTQTEAVNKLPQLVLDALDMDDQDEDTWLSNNEKRKKKKRAEEELDEDYILDEEDDDYSASLPTKPITVHSVSKIMSSLMQSREEWLVRKLINRIANTDDKKIHLQVMNMHGYRIFNNLLRDWKTKTDDLSLIQKVLEIMTKWPRLTRNKISSSKIEVTVEEISKECEEEEITELAKTLLSEWSSLKIAYRIPRRERKTTEETKDEAESEDNSNHKASSTTATEEFDATGRLIKKTEASSSSTRLHTFGTFDNNDSKHNTPFSSQQPPFKKFKKFDPPNQDRYADLRLPEGPRKIVMAQRAAAAAQAAQAQAAVAGMQSLEGGLPPGWHSAKAPSGRAYYYNRALGITQWDRPVSQLVKNIHSASQENMRQKSLESGVGADENGNNNDTEESRKATQERMLQKIIEQALDSNKMSSTGTATSTMASITSAPMSGQPSLIRNSSTTQLSRHSSVPIASESSNLDLHAYGHEQSNALDSLDMNGFGTAGGSTMFGYNSDERSLSPQILDGPGVSPGLEAFTDHYSEAQIRILQKSFAKVVPNIVVRYKDYIGHEKVKIYSREIVHILVSKELRGKPAKISPDLTTEKRTKIKVFVKTYMAKVVQKIKALQELQQAGSSKASDTPLASKPYSDFQESQSSTNMSNNHSNDLFDSSSNMPSLLSQQLVKLDDVSALSSLSSPLTADTNMEATSTTDFSTAALSSSSLAANQAPGYTNTANGTTTSTNVQAAGIRGTIPSAPAGFNNKDYSQQQQHSSKARTLSNSGLNEGENKFGFKGQAHSSMEQHYQSQQFGSGNDGNSNTGSSTNIHYSKHSSRYSNKFGNGSFRDSKRLDSFSNGSNEFGASDSSTPASGNAIGSDGSSNKTGNPDLSFKRQNSNFRDSSASANPHYASESFRNYKASPSASSLSNTNTNNTNGSSSSTSWSAQQKLVMMAPPQYGDDYAGGDDCNETEVGMAALNAYNNNNNNTTTEKVDGLNDTNYNETLENGEDYNHHENGADEEHESGNDHEMDHHNHRRQGYDRGRGGYHNRRGGRGGFYRNKRGGGKNNNGGNGNKKFGGSGHGHNGNKFMNGHGNNKGKFAGNRGKFKKNGW